MRKFLSAFFVLFSVAQTFAVTWTIVDVGFTFSPDSITITQGDSVSFVLGGAHNAQEVDQLTWNANSSGPVTGFSTPFTGGIVTGLSVGVHYYVCVNHAGAGMKGRVFVQPPPPSVQFVITSSTHSEGAGTFGVAVSIANPNSNPTSVDINIASGATATSAGVDYSFSPVTVTFPANSTTAQIVTVTLNDDQLIEGTENFTFQLAFPTNNAMIGVNAQHAVTLTDNDVLEISFAITLLNQYENIGQVNVPVHLSSSSAAPTSVTVHLESAGTTATQGSDFFFTDTTITWAANTNGTIMVPLNVVDDTMFEPSETVRISLINPTNGATFLNDTFLLTIVNNDQQIFLDCADLFFSEYTMAATPGRALEIYNPTSQPVDLSEYTILQSTDGGTSIEVFGLNGILEPDSVYVIGHSGSQPEILAQADTLTTFLTYDGNDAIALLHFTDTIDIIGELRVNPGLAFAVDAGSTWYNTIIRKNYTFHGGTDWNVTSQSWFGFPSMFDSLGFHRMAVCGSTPPKATIRFISSGVTVPESIGTLVQVIVETINPTNSPVSFVVGHNNAVSTATIQADYGFNVPTYTHNTGTSYDTLLVTVFEDQLLEATETAVIYLANVTGNGKFVADSVFNLNITDNDVLTVSFNGAGFSYLEDTNLVEVKITLSGSVPDSTSLFVSLATGNAIKGVDFTFNDTTIVFPPFTMDTQSIWVHIIDDTVVEVNEQINFSITNVTNGAQVAISAYTLTIIDNDLPSGIDKTDLAAGVKMYPTPVMNALTIQTEHDLENVTVTDLLGNSVMQLKKVAVGKNVIDVSMLSPGIYFLAAGYEQNFFSKRFIKQN